MAIFHMQIKTVARSAGRNAPASAAYRAGERIRNERTGMVYDHSKRRDVLHKEIILPSGLEPAGAALQWALDRATLWNAAEGAEHQRNSRVAREYMVALPAELSPEQRVALAHALSRDIADRFQVAVDLAVHAPRPHGDPRNFHAHLLATTREVTAEGLGAKVGLDMQGTVRAELGMPTAREQFKALRKRWAELANEALRTAHLAERVDDRSLAEQGIDREPLPRLPVAAVAALRRGERSKFVERLSERYRRRFVARPFFGSSESVVSQAAPTPKLTRTASLTSEEETPTPQQVASDPDGRRRRAVKDWVTYRAQQGRPIGSSGRDGQGQGPEIEAMRRRAVEAWRSMREQEAGSPSCPKAHHDENVVTESVLGQRSRDRDLSR